MTKLPPTAKLKEQDVDGWNEWRRLNSDVVPDLGGAELAGLRLSGVDLSNANLTAANLTKAQLAGADFSGTLMPRARLAYTDLANAIFRGAKLSGADLSHAWLREAHFDNADLRDATFSGADLEGATLEAAYATGANFRDSHLRRARFFRSNLYRADLTGAVLASANLVAAHLIEATMSGAMLTGALLSGANLNRADLSGAELTHADLTTASLVETRLCDAYLLETRVFGISAWKVDLRGSTQRRLVITEKDEPVITVDDLEVAQFIYLLLHNEKMRSVIDTVTSTAVLLLGRFTPVRKAVLEAIHVELRSRGYLPILFDFDKPVNRSVTETVLTLAALSRFVIADLTDAASVQQELSAIAFSPLQNVAVQPVILRGSREWSMFVDLQLGASVLPPYVYASQDELINSLASCVLDPVEREAQSRRETMARMYAEASARRHL